MSAGMRNGAMEQAHLDEDARSGGRHEPASAHESSRRHPGASRVPTLQRFDPFTLTWLVCGLIFALSYLYGVGWILGILVMWTSPLWTARVKVLATAFLPAFLLGSFIWFDLVLVAIYIAPLATAALLYLTSSATGRYSQGRTRAARKDLTV